MKTLTKSTRSARALLAVSLLLVGLTVAGGGCPPVAPPPAGGGCTSDDDCAEGQVCNADTGTCEAAPAACTSDDDCDEGQVCNTDTGQCESVPAPCASDDDCAEGQVCNTETGECEPAPTGCTAEDDCDQGEFCDIQTGDCVVNTNSFETVTFDHSFHMGVFDCTTCHHAGLTACDECHDRDEVVNGVPTLKDAQHNPDQYGCWSCHDEENPDGTRDCSVCHTALDEQ